MPQLNPVFAALPVSIFQHMTGLALRHDAINLGQGFPDEDGPLRLREVAAKALLEGPNQYPPSRGLGELRVAVAAHARGFYGLDYDPEDEVVITSGGTEALAACILACAVPGDEFVLIEPTYDSYRPIVEATGAVVRAVKLSPPGWRLTEEALRAAIGPRTRAVLINSPHNPAGRVFSRAELEILARVVQETDAVVICDEVYEHLVFDGLEHVPLATLPGMRERCLRIGSAGKIFSLTGWKVGWVTGPRHLVAAATRSHQFLTFTTPPALQMGVAHGLAHEMDFPLALTRRLQKNRDILAAGLTRMGFAVQPCEGTYFLTAGISKITNEKDFAFCERLIREAGVALIPLSAFFRSGTPDSFVRFAFCKQQALIEQSLARLEKYFAQA
ncbi:MAG: aminotransferase [Alphaproteobacteria bacterium 65-7]|nr:MAG: aminotransferase [Alphaproteobacteria bacterium 65-7]